MTTAYIQGAPAPTDSAEDFAACPLPLTNSAPHDTPDKAPHRTLEGPIHTPVTGDCEPVRHLLFGSLSAVRATIHHLHTLRYAEANDWSQPIPTGRANEVMATLTRRVRRR